MLNVIKFYSSKGDYGCFSNFSRHSIELNNSVWPTSEHFYQAQKFTETEYKTKVLEAKGPMAAAIVGRDRENPLRDDWESIKDEVMYEAIRAKFTQHEDLKEILLSTGDARLIEDSPTDYYWGCGAKGNGKNMLGVLLMRFRDELNNESNQET